MTEKETANALINETSPYLLQHAHNPVAWYPWGEEAIELARADDKPILLSVGYSACHWCHVMAHESFENIETARLMNELFINIKVDREERPDLDKIYQLAQQLLTQRSGGWPLTMFLSPDDHIPFFGGTYFPPENRYGMPGFADVLTQVAAYYRQEQEAISNQKAHIMKALDQIQISEAATDTAELTPAPLHTSVRELGQAFDHEHGGFGGAPKFPTPGNTERLLHQHVLFNSDDQILKMACSTLEKMASGGIYDQVGGGFCRYSVDEKWMIPHFEKMLYDNGPLLALYCDAWYLDSNPLFKKIALETADWIIKEMQSPDGGYYSSLDADSEGEEGKFYVWTPDQARSILDENEFEPFCFHTGLDLPPNFEGNWHLFTSQPVPAVAEKYSLDEEAATRLIYSARCKLYAVRKDRIWPGRDEKILVSWNALAIKGMAIAAMRFNREDYLASVEKALSFLHHHLWKDDRLLATCKDGKAHINAYLDDYAFLIDAVLNLLAANWTSTWLHFAIQLAENLLDNFYDAEKGAFFFTSHDHERLIQRRKEYMDDAIPCGNGVAALSLARLGHLINEPRYIDAAKQTLLAAWGAIERMPSAHNSLLFALEDYCFPPTQIILRGEEDTIKAWQKQCRSLADIRTLIFAIPDHEQGLPGSLQHRTSDAQASAYICEGFTCLEPVTDVQVMADHLKRKTRMG